MTRVLNLFALIAAAVLPVQAQSSFIDSCTTFNSNLWNKANWALGLGSVSSGNVNPSGGGVLNFEIPAGTRNGGEIVSKAKYSYGQVEAQFKVPNLPGVISSIFMYQGTSTSDEIDVEVYLNQGKWEIAFTVYRLGVKEWSKGYFPTWDPSAGYNDYMIDYQEAAISFYVNGALEAQFHTPSQQPVHPMNIQVNAWFPEWLNGKAASSTQYMQVNQISYTQA
ncbi:glycoside hydrolase family 16 [Trichoderma arundinaceum]|uniref:Glycoside hydrolase family 16 n=1 Tax=Trichoderma arundinaceum TaxID=490622 RepID=A0A395NN33_TRIAR|nr:glycoside hydrolase family 16 [Trichoderma arundinaceum]